MEADAPATVLTVLGPDDGLAFARRHGVARCSCAAPRRRARAPSYGPAWPIP